MTWISTHIPPWFWIALVVHGVVLGTVAYLILLERKVASWVQDRIGPNRVGPFGLLQPIADGLKFILKEDYRPGGVDKVLFTLAPGVMIFVIIISIAVIPWGGIKQTRRVVGVTQELQHGGVVPWTIVDHHVPYGATVVGTPTLTVDTAGGAETHPPVDQPAHIGPGDEAELSFTYRWPFQIADLNIGVLFILATLSLAVYGVVVGGWASNNKYSFLGGLRATANMISYEVPLGLAILTIVVMYGTLNLGTIVDKQATYWAHVIPAWNVFTQPLAFLMFLVCIHAEANRAPFDTAEAEQELVGGYHTEYSSMRFALFFLAEYAGMITTSAVCVALFFGGWHLPWIDKLWPALSGGVDPARPEITTSIVACLIRAVVFFAKTIGVIFVFMWVRWSLPRFRFDQIMNLAWRALIPIALLVLMVTAIIVWWWGGDGRAYLRVGGRMALVLFIVNVLMLGAILVASRLVPAAPDTNRKIRVVGSRYEVARPGATIGAVAPQV